MRLNKFFDIQLLQMRHYITSIILVLVVNMTCQQLLAQAGTNESNFMGSSANAIAANKMGNDVNLYTGMPSISLPLYSYNHPSGIGLSISADYFPGGIKVAESASSLGLGWNLSVGGVITRTVRGMPDEYPVNGYLFATALPADYRPNGNKYYYDSLDAQQDIFQFNVNGRSGKFFIGKNNQIVVVPLSKIQISYGTNPAISTPIGTFTITTEDGVKYVFSDVETMSSYVQGYSSFVFGYQNFEYPQAWYLSKIVAPFSTDSIRFNYSSINNSGGFRYPETVHVNGSGNVYNTFKGTGNRTINGQRKIASINLPDKKNISFVYDPSLQYDGTDSVLDKVKFSDSIFRYGFIFDRQAIYYNSTTAVGWEDSIVPVNRKPRSIMIDKRSFLSGIKYYTKAATMPGYDFSYLGPLFSKVNSYGDTISNKRDYWGYYKNSIPNDSSTIPNVPGIYTRGADRSASGIYDILASSLSSIADPTGGTTIYTYEPNTIYPFNTSAQAVAINAVANTQTNITLSQVVSNQYEFTVAFNNTVSRVGNPTFSGTANLTCSITSIDGLTVYATKIFSLFQVFYTGSMSFKASITGGAYLLKTTISAGTTAPSGLPINITWDNETAGTGTGNVVGGVRIKTISTYRPLLGMPNQMVNEKKVSYKYETSDGKSSGFLGLPPVYHYPITNVNTTNWINPVTTYGTAISSEPVSNLNYTQGNAVGYSRVEVVQEGTSLSGKNGKTVYEFTNLKDAGTNVKAASFPYAPVTQEEWALGLPKRVLVYDSSSRLIKSTTNTYSYTNTLYENSNFQSLKLGMAVYNTNYNTSTLVVSHTNKGFTGQLYYPESGRADLITTIDTFYHTNNSQQISRIDIEYDTNFNAVKTTSVYDKTRGLVLEKRMYYPYSYNLTGTIGKLKSNKIFLPVSTEQWITGDGNPRMLGATITDYQELTKGYIRPLNIYSFQSKFPVAEAIIGVFNPNLLVRNSTYLLLQQNLAAYDTAGNATEIKNSLTSQSNLVLLDYANQFPVAKISNAKLPNVAYTSFESDSKGQWTIANYVKNKTNAITGKCSYRLDSGSISKSGLNVDTTYIITYWTTNAVPVSITGASNITLAAQQNGWKLYTQTISGLTSVTISGTGLIDELRLHPKNANMLTTTYDPMVGPTSVCDANNTIMYNEYDALNRLIIVRDKDLNILSKNEFSNTNLISTTPNWQGNGEVSCSMPLRGVIDTGQTNINIYSDTYNAKRFVFGSDSSNACVPTCTGVDYKLLNYVCELGAKVYTSTVYRKVCDANFVCAYKWECTYHYAWSDGSVSGNFIEYSSTACAITP